MDKNKHLGENKNYCFLNNGIVIRIDKIRMMILNIKPKAAAIAKNNNSILKFLSLRKVFKIPFAAYLNE